MELGITGINSRAVCESARKLGHKVFLVDYYQDLDVSADQHFFMQEDPKKPDLEDYSPERMVSFAEEKLAGKVDKVMVTSEVGCRPDLLRRLEKGFRVLGNSSEQAAKAKRWAEVQKALDSAGVNYPKTELASSPWEVESAALEMGYPVVVKGPGFNTQLIHAENIGNALACGISGEVWVQEYMAGYAVSASVLGDGKEAIALSANKQLIGCPELGASGFTYCGNIVSLGSTWDREVREAAEKIISSLGLVGSVGVDFLLSEEGLVFMEINPRFQDTLECVEKHLGLNLVDAHLQALEGKLPETVEGSGCHGKGILYAKEDSAVGDLKDIPGLGDIPHPGAEIRKDQPVCSVYASGEDPEQVFYSLAGKAAEVKSRLKPVF